MAENDTLLAHLVLDVRITRQVEVAATRSLTYILNKSDSAKEAMSKLVESKTGAKLGPIKRFVAEDEYRVSSDIGRVDFTGYDISGEKLIVGEAKFDAAISRGQGGGYLNQLSKEGDAVLMFVVPHYRINYLWKEVKSDIERTEGPGKFDEHEVQDSIKSAKVEREGTNWYLMMVGWRNLLEELDNGIEETSEKAGVKSDISQLWGIAERMDYAAFKPIQNMELENFARRWGDLHRLFNDVIEGNIGEGKPFSLANLRRTGSEDGYVRYFQYQASGVNAWIGFRYSYWCKGKNTPVWFGLTGLRDNNGLGEETYKKVEKALAIRYGALEDGAIPITLKEGKDRQELLEDLLCQLTAFGKVIKEAAPDTPSP